MKAAVCCLALALALCATTSASGPRLTATPTQLTQGTGDLTLDCRVDKDQDWMVISTVSIIFTVNAPSSGTTAAVTTTPITPTIPVIGPGTTAPLFAPPTTTSTTTTTTAAPTSAPSGPKTLATIAGTQIFNSNTNITASGHSDVNGTSLRVVIKDPSRLEAGKYECKVTGVDSQFQQLLNNTEVIIPFHNATKLELEQLMVELQHEIKSLKQRWHQIDHNSMFIYSQTFKNRKYLLSNSQVEHVTVCQFMCVVQGGYLAEINDQAEMDFVKNFTKVNLHKIYDYPDVYVGATDRGHKGQWKPLQNVNDTILPAWGAAQSRGYDCMVLSQDAGYLMNDFTCDAANRFLCEIPQ